MKSIHFFLLCIAVITFSLITTVSIGQKNTFASPTTNDTIPKRVTNNIEEALQDVELSRVEMEKALKEIDWQKIQKEIQAAVHAINIDVSKIKNDVDKALKEVDFKKIESEVNLEIKEADVQKMQLEIKASLAKVDWEKMNKEIEKIKSLELEKLGEELKKIKPQIEESMSKVKVDVARARQEIKEYNNFINGLHADGLIDKNNDYQVELIKSVLYINGEKAPVPIVEKYNNFLKGRKDFKVTKEGDGFKFNN